MADMEPVEAQAGEAEAQAEAALEPVRVSLDARSVEVSGRQLRGVAATTGRQLQKPAFIPGHGQVNHMFFHDGCFDVSLGREDFDIDLVLGHDTRQRPWASVSAGNLRAEMVGNKLEWEADLPDVRTADNLVVALENGEFGGCSVGGRVPPPFEVSLNGVLQVREYDIHGGDLSLVPVPANDHTWVEVALEAEDEELRKGLAVILDKRLPAEYDAKDTGAAPGTGGNHHDRTYRKIVVQLWRERLASEL